MPEEKKDKILPPRPGDEKTKKEIKGKIFAIYINGQLHELSKTEALGVLAQISQILCYFDQQENE